MVFVLMENTPKESIDMFKKRVDLTKSSVMLDEERAWYAAVGNAEPVNLITHYLLSPTSLWNTVRKHGSEGNQEGTKDMKGGLFVIKPDGTEAFRHREESFGNWTPLESLRNAVRNLGNQ